MPSLHLDRTSSLTCPCPDQFSPNSFLRIQIAALPLSHITLVGFISKAQCASPTYYIYIVLLIDHNLLFYFNHSCILGCFITMINNLETSFGYNLCCCWHQLFSLLQWNLPKMISHENSFVLDPSTITTNLSIHNEMCYKICLTLYL